MQLRCDDNWCFEKLNRVLYGHGLAVAEYRTTLMTEAIRGGMAQPSFLLGSFFKTHHEIYYARPTEFAWVVAEHVLHTESRAT